MPPVPITNVTFDCDNPPLLSDFWSQAIGYVQKERSDYFASLAHPKSAGPNLFFIKVPEPKTVKNRVHIDVKMDNLEQDEQRLIALGARKLRHVEEYGMSWTVMADPEGNEFCIHE